jgi:hypothetical protein
LLLLLSGSRNVPCWKKEGRDEEREREKRRIEREKERKGG